MNQKDPTKRRVLHLSEETESIIYDPDKNTVNIAKLDNMGKKEIQSIIDFLHDVQKVMNNEPDHPDLIGLA